MCVWEVIFSNQYEAYIDCQRVMQYLYFYTYLFI